MSEGFRLPKGFKRGRERLNFSLNQPKSRLVISENQARECLRVTSPPVCFGDGRGKSPSQKPRRQEPLPVSTA